MRFGAAQKFALVLGCVVLAVASGHADSELQKFEATIPPQAKLGIAKYQACAISTAVDKKKEGALFQVIELAIAKDCKKHIADADRDLAKAGISADERAKIIERFSALALAERRLAFEGKPIPGYRMSPETARMMECTKRDTYRAIDSCFVEQGRPLVQSSTEQPETIALAVDGACRGAQAKLIRQLMACMTATEAQTLVQTYVRSLRLAVISAVVQERSARGSGSPR
jgi:hypothetical protein